MRLSFVLAFGCTPARHRVFTLSFPDRATQERSFADERYLAVRREFFAPAVGHVATLAEFDEPVSR